MGTYRVVAFNTATASANKIHDDEVARRYGFGGGLVPGVDVYAYMTHPPAEAWGLDWLSWGSMQARFLAPVYEGDDVTLDYDLAGDRMTIELRNAEGVVCATGRATVGGGPRPLPEPSASATTAPPPELPEASPVSLAVGTALRLGAHRFHADLAGEYLADVREGLPLYAEARVAHPGWLLRDANYVLSRNVALGPWIHVESVTRHFGLVQDGDEVDAHATVTREWEHKGHRFVELDVLLVVDGKRPAVRVTHTAIYRPRNPG